MVAIRNFIFGSKERWGKGLWLGALLAFVAVGVSLAEGMGGGDKPPLDDATASGSTLSAALPVPTVPLGAAIDEQHTPSPAVATTSPDAEQQRRLFMLLLLNSAGPLRPYSGLSR